MTLLGNAAHPLLPHTGQGAAQAIVDAVALGQVLGEGANVADALQAYERERRPRTAVLVAQGRRMARVMRTTNPIACSLREVAIRLVPVELSVKLYATPTRSLIATANSAGSRQRWVRCRGRRTSIDTAERRTTLGRAT